MIHIKRFGFIKKVFFAGLTVLSYVNPLSANQLGCISMYFESNLISTCNLKDV